MALENFPERRRRIFEMSRFKYEQSGDCIILLHLSVRTIEHQIYLFASSFKENHFNFIFPVFSFK